MKVNLINNYAYRGNWSNIFHCVYREDGLGIKHFLFGLFGFFVFIAW